MNPVLLKPQSETGSQIIVQGKVWGQAKGRDYQAFKAQLLDAVMASWDIVRAGADLVIVEGAGSPAEINLRAGDIREDREMIAGYIINKFRGDVSLFDDGLKAITQFTGWPSFGVVPWLKDAARLPAEDSVVLERLVKGEGRALKIAVPVLDRIANFDDLDPLM
eukprot:gene30734-38343_t